MVRNLRTAIFFTVTLIFWPYSLILAAPHFSPQIKVSKEGWEASWYDKARGQHHRHFYIAKIRGEQIQYKNKDLLMRLRQFSKGSVREILAMRKYPQKSWRVLSSISRPAKIYYNESLQIAIPRCEIQPGATGLAEQIKAVEETLSSGMDTSLVTHLGGCQDRQFAGQINEGMKALKTRFFSSNAVELANKCLGESNFAKMQAWYAYLLYSGSKINFSCVGKQDLTVEGSYLINISLIKSSEPVKVRVQHEVLHNVLEWNEEKTVEAMRCLDGESALATNTGSTDLLGLDTPVDAAEGVPETDANKSLPLTQGGKEYRPSQESLDAAVNDKKDKDGVTLPSDKEATEIVGRDVAIRTGDRVYASVVPDIIPRAHAEELEALTDMVAEVPTSEEVEIVPSSPGRRAEAGRSGKKGSAKARDVASTPSVEALSAEIPATESEKRDTKKTRGVKRFEVDITPMKEFEIEISELKSKTKDEGVTAMKAKTEDDSVTPTSAKSTKKGAAAASGPTRLFEVPGKGGRVLRGDEAAAAINAGGLAALMKDEIRALQVLTRPYEEISPYITNPSERAEISARAARFGIRAQITLEGNKTLVLGASCNQANTMLIKQPDDFRMMLTNECK